MCVLRDLDRISAAQARAVARHDAVAHLRNTAVLCEAALASALAAALADPDRAGAYLEVARAAETSLDHAAQHWRGIDVDGD